MIILINQDVLKPVFDYNAMKMLLGRRVSISMNIIRGKCFKFILTIIAK